MFHYLKRIVSREELYTNPELGSSFEGYVLEQIIHSSLLRGDGTEAFFFRTSDDYEVDLLLQRGRELVAIEVKSKLSVSKRDIKGLLKILELLPISKALVITLGDHDYLINPKVRCLGIKQIAEKICQRFWD
jgi:predicted AAA+ superfamily ATPase